MATLTSKLNCKDRKDNDSTQPQLANIDLHTGYISNIDDIRALYYPSSQETIYLDHAGATTYPTCLIDSYADDLRSNLFGNPHSASASSQLSKNRIDALRVKVLKYFKADPDEFDLIFVANATAGIKLVADAFRDLDQGFWYGYHRDAHTSLVGVRELAFGSKCINDAEMEAIVHGKISEVDQWSTVLLGYPGQSNMTGQRYSLERCKELRQTAIRTGRPLYSLYDAASLLSTSLLDLSHVDDAPDFTVLSFYKIFGFPDLGGLIVRNTSAEILRRRRYFGGGTVDVVSTGETPWHAKRDSISSSLEDGTLPFHTIIALEHAMKSLEQIFGGMHNVSRHTHHLSTTAYTRMKSLNHANGQILCEIYSSDPVALPLKAGPIITFNLRDRHGHWISHSEVEKLAAVNGIQFRTGGLCNPGGTATHLDLSTDRIKKNYDAGQRCDGSMDLFDGQPTGTIRISFGASSSMSDVNSFITFLQDFFIDRSTSPNTHVVPSRPPEFKVASISIYPIKSCRGYSIPAGQDWKIYSQGLEFDREWCLVHQGTNVALNQKQFPHMAKLQPSIDLDNKLLRVQYLSEPASSHKSTPSINIKLDEYPAFESILTTQCERFRSQNSSVCGETILVHIYTSQYITDFFTDALNVPCTLARFPRETPRQTHIRRPASSPEPSPQRSSFGIKLSNESPILLVSQSSVDQLNLQIQRKPNQKVQVPIITADSFRANIVIKDTKDSQAKSAYMEDYMRCISIRGVKLDVLGPCQRCQMVCVDQHSGQRRSEPFSTLAKTRRKDGRVWFGMHLCLVDDIPPGSLQATQENETTALIGVGDFVDVEMSAWSSSPNSK